MTPCKLISERTRCMSRPTPSSATCCQGGCCLDLEESRTLAKQALDMIRARHAKYFTGDNAVFATLDDVWLCMEGMGSGTPTPGCRIPKAARWSATQPSRK
jgi:hypothetical protein